MTTNPIKNGATPVAEVLVVTPGTAAAWLTKNTSNRPLSKATVDKYAAAMARGEWALNGEPIIFDTNGVLANGQHRLQACIQADTPFETFVVNGIKPEAFLTLDTGKMRSSADTLAISGEKNYVKLAAAARGYLKLSMTERETRNITHTMIKACLDAHPKLREWTEKFESSKTCSLPSFIISVLTAMDELHGKLVADVFFEKAVIGVGLVKTDPEFWLRARLSTDKTANHSNGSRDTVRQDYAHQLVIKAANLRLQGREASVLRINKGESRPQLIGFVKA